MNRAVVPADLDALVAAVGAALDGDGRPSRPSRCSPAPGSGSTPADVPAGTALVLRTSGSTGTPREVLLGADALRASGAATHERLGGPGHWLLTLPPTHVAGVQVVARAHAAGRGLTVAPRASPSPRAGSRRSSRAPRARGERRYVSLVPTQLHRLVAAADAGTDDGAAGLDALRALDAVLLGGAATPPALLRRARSAGARVVTTYGMTETCGGCVYDGVALPGPASGWSRRTTRIQASSSSRGRSSRTATSGSRTRPRPRSARTTTARAGSARATSAGSTARRTHRCSPSSAARTT